MESGLKCLSANLAMARRCSEISDLSKPCSIAGGYRNKFMCDRDRILYCKSFLRLAGKTQVYTPSQGDHQRTRLTHTLEVSQIARTIAKALDLDCDLTEAIALGHDIGHTPFGHAGERMLHEIMTPTNNEFSQVPKTTSLYTLKKSRQETLKQYYGFKHNLQSIRCLLDDLDSRDSKYGSNKKSGHIQDFADRGITDVKTFLYNVIQQAPVDSGGTTKKWAEYIIDGKKYLLAYGDNGFIVSFYPHG